MGTVMPIKPLGFVLVAMLCGVAPSFGEGATPLGAWQNPNMGWNADVVLEMNNARSDWMGNGFTLRSLEFLTQSSIDPYASMNVNILFSQTGAELHEMYVEFPFLPVGLSARAGLMLANFGRWNQFHLHFMPFASEPRIYHEYIAGIMALRGVEFSWMPTLPHYVEWTFSVYDLLEGHTHDQNPPDQSGTWTPARVAELIGAVPHGNHYDYGTRHIYNDDDLYTIAGLPSPRDPIIYRGARRPVDFAWGSRLKTTLEFGLNWSADVGASFLHQKRWARSQRSEEGFAEFYNKTLWGADVVFFWHPLRNNKYYNAQIGVEYLGSSQVAERLNPNPGAVTMQRHGYVAHADVQLNPKYKLGGFQSTFLANNLQRDVRQHHGVYVTWMTTHYQYFRLEWSRYDYPDYYQGVQRIMLQYNTTIGYHSHGSQR
jgi:hypothetical protein